VRDSIASYLIQGCYRSGKTGKGQGILVVRESQGKCKSEWKVREMLGKFFTFRTVVVMLITAVRLELIQIQHTVSSSSMATMP